MAFGLVLGLIGSGVGASFIWNGSATQAINIGTLTMQVSSTTPNAHVTDNTLTCPAIVIDNSAGFSMAGEPVPTCNLTVTSTGTIPAKNLSVFMTVAGGAELDKWQVSASGAITATKLFSAPVPAGDPGVPMGVATTFPASINFAFDYGYDIGGLDLTNASLAKTITVTFLLSVAQ
jgi:hypothetical protein